MDSVQHEKLLQNLREITMNFPGAMVVFTCRDGELARYSVNRKFAELLDYSCPEEALAFLSENPFDAVHPQDLPALQAKVQKALKDFQPFQHSYRLRRHHGGYFWVELSISVLEHDPDFGVVFTGAYVDITAQKIAEQHYAEQYSYRENILKATAVASAKLNFTTNMVSEIFSIDAELRARMERCHEDIAVFLRDIRDSLPVSEENARFAVTFNVENLLNAFTLGRRDFSMELRSTRGGLELCWTRFVISMLNNPFTNNIEGYIYAFDAERERFSGEVIDSFVGNVCAGVACVDIANHWYRTVSLGNFSVPIPQEGDYEATRKHYIAYRVAEEDKETALRESSLDYVTGVLEKTSNSTLYYHTSDGTRYLRLQFYYLNQLKKRLVLVATDVTSIVMQEKQMQARLEDAVQNARRAEKAKSVFLSNMSHDIRTPMNAIIGLSSIMLRSGEVSGISRDFIEKIHHAGEYLLGLVNDILDISKIENRKMTLNPEPYSFAEFSAQIHTIIDPLLANKNIEFVITYDGNVNYQVKTDRLRINQIFINLLSNAAKFTPPGGKVELIAHYAGTFDGKLRNEFIIRDNGAGMSRDFLPHLFDAFSQENAQGYNEQRRGTGLGMAIVKNLVELMGGSITVNSELGKGTEFKVVLDFTPATITAIMKRAGIIAVSSADVFAGRKVLLAEDDEINREIANILLKEKGLIVTNAVNGREAVEVFSASPPGGFDLVLMDMRMPEMDGLQAARAIRGLKRDDAVSVPIVAMTANVMEDDVHASQTAGMNAHLGKPIDEVKMWEVLGNLLQNSSHPAETPGG